MSAEQEALQIEQELFRSLKEWRANPDIFCKDVLNVTLLDWQVKAFYNILVNPRLSIRSGHSVGKSTFLSCFSLWFLICHFPAKVVVTAPTSRQLYDVLWSEIAKIASGMLPVARQTIVILKDRIEVVGFNKESFITARTAKRDSPEALQGIHGKHVALVVDEASGIDDRIYEAGEGSLATDNAKTILCGNPTRNKGYFKETFSDSSWINMHVSCMDSPIVSRSYIDYMAKKYGEESNQYKIRVLGDFPERDEDVVIPQDLVSAAMGREVEPNDVWPVWGLDVARFGSNKTALCKRQGNVLLEPVTFWGGADTMQTVGRVVDIYESTDDHMKPSAICVDVIGVGSGVYDRLAELGLPVIGINVAEMPSIRERFINLRSELWFRAREWFETRAVAMVGDDDLISQLTDITYRYSDSGKYVVESKADMLRRGVESPDLADSFILTFASGRDLPRNPELPSRYTYKKQHRGSWMSS
jgi:phage terminase large subunit